MIIRPQPSPLLARSWCLTCGHPHARTELLTRFPASNSNPRHNRVSRKSLWRNEGSHHIDPIRLLCRSSTCVAQKGVVDALSVYFTNNVRTFNCIFTKCVLHKI
ncbi:uncharacterized protein LOC111262625 [Varroa jacobsoni]|uniref:uncharacterized protein LOC111262625 n=1 Tax=Varroa jacobsoni TaxID=62625 RepID=UPI000BF52412|nr:uncharacterized protein LOC111262625 [Varroa jacobsoni]